MASAVESTAYCHCVHTLLTSGHGWTPCPEEHVGTWHRESWWVSVERQLGLQQGIVHSRGKRIKYCWGVHGEGLRRRVGRYEEPKRGFSVGHLTTLSGCRLAKNPADRQSRLALICTLVGALHLFQHPKKPISFDSKVTWWVSRHGDLPPFWELAGRPEVTSQGHSPIPKDR